MVLGLEQANRRCGLPGSIETLFPFTLDPMSEIFSNNADEDIKACVNCERGFKIIKCVCVRVGVPKNKPYKS